MEGQRHTWQVLWSLALSVYPFWPLEYDVPNHHHGPIPAKGKCLHPVDCGLFHQDSPLHSVSHTAHSTRNCPPLPPGDVPPLWPDQTPDIRPWGTIYDPGLVGAPFQPQYTDPSFLCSSPPNQWPDGRGQCHTRTVSYVLLHQLPAGLLGVAAAVC